MADAVAPGRGGPQQIPRPPQVDVGLPAPWTGSALDDLDLSLDRIRRLFAGAGPVVATRPETGPEFDPGSEWWSAQPADGAVRSAVAVVISGAGDAHGNSERVDPKSTELLLTRRAWHLRTHRGEVAFPGGIEDPGDVFPAGTALREAHEEVGLDPSTVEVIGALEPLTTFASRASILPVVAITEVRPQVVASPDEVDGVLHVRMLDLLHPDCYRNELWSWPGNDAVRAIDRHPMHFFEIPGDTIWGATAAMVFQLLTLVTSVER